MNQGGLSSEPKGSRLTNTKVLVTAGLLVVVVLIGVAFLVTRDSDNKTTTDEQGQDGSENNNDGKPQTATSLASGEQNQGDNALTPSADEADNLQLILGNSATRNPMFDNNKYADVPMDQIPIDDLIVAGDIYNEVLIANDSDGLFRVKCEVTHFSYDDPIVFPNDPGRAHLHMFFGNTKANAFSTYESLLNTGTGSCNGEDLNRTAYWVPAMLDSEGNALLPMEVMVYYKNTNFKLNGANHAASAFPDDLKIIAGQALSESDQTKSTGPGSINEVSFGCGGFYRAQEYYPTMPNCSGNNGQNYLELKIAFPSCWSPDKGTYQKDQSHVSHPQSGFWLADCPASHPVKMPSVMYRIFFRVSDYGDSNNGWFLSSDGLHGDISKPGLTLHADWYGAWNSEAMDRWVENCTNVGRTDCEIGIMSRNPDTSLVARKEGYYKAQKIPAAELAKLCPWEPWDGTAVGISHCR